MGVVYRIRALRALEDTKLPLAFQEYIDLVEYINTIHTEAPSLALASHLVAMALSVWNALVKVLSKCVLCLQIAARSAWKLTVRTA